MDAFSTPFAHLDMDAFYVEVERLDDASLRGVPVIVGGLGNRGVVAAASYEARRHGVRSAMPIVEARRRLPRARYLPPDIGKYSAMSARVFAILDEFTPEVEPLSVDEAFLNLAGLRRHYSTPFDVAVAMRQRIRAELDLPASVGLAAVKFLAKMASKEAKPDGIFVVEAGRERAFLDALPVSDLWGVGQATLASLGGLGIETIGQLADTPEALLRRQVGAASAAHLAALANGRDPRTVETGREAKSVSVESTFPEDLHGKDAVEHALLELCHRLSGRLLNAHLAGKTVTLKLRLGDFTTVTRSATRGQALSDTSQIWPIARELLGKVLLGGQGVRLLGVGVSALSEGGPTQMALDGSDRSALAEATSEVRERYGDDAVIPARLAGPPGRDMGV